MDNSTFNILSFDGGGIRGTLSANLLERIQNEIKQYLSVSTRRYNQSILKEISPGCSLEGLMLRLKLQYFGHVMQRADTLEKTLMLGKIEDRRRRGQ